MQPRGPFLDETKLLAIKVIIFLAAAYILKHIAESWLCTQLNPCPLDANQIPLILGGFKDAGLLIPALFVLFSLPVGYFAVVATIVGLQAGLAAGLNWVELTILYLLASTVSVCATYFTIRFVYVKHKNSRIATFWLKRFKAFETLSKKLLGKTGIFTGLALANAFSSLIYTSMLAVLLDVPVPQALAALFTGNIISYILAALIILGASVFTTDILIATIIAIGASLLIAYFRSKIEKKK